MNHDQHIRPITSDDIPVLKNIIDANQLFPSELLDEMVVDFLNNTKSKDIWLTYDDDKPEAIAFCAPEKMTEGTWNVYLIAVHPNKQGKGYGSALMKYIEKTLTENGERLLIVETSGLDAFEQTQKFYKKNDFIEEARIRDFYQAGDDKIIFWKSLV